MRNCAFLEEFEKPKIIYPETTVRRGEFVYDDSKIYLDKTCFFISGKDLKFLNSLLNSKLIQYFLETTLRIVGKTTIQYSKQYMSNLPLPKTSEERQKPFINLVDTILQSKETIKKYNKHFDSLNAIDKIEIKEEIEKLEILIKDSMEEIDNMVYKLYGLSDDEIRIVEGNL